MQTFGGTRVAFGATNGEIVLWDLPTDQVRYLSKNLHNRYVDKMEFAADGRLFISDNDLEVWNPDTGELLAEMPGVRAFALNQRGDVWLVDTFASSRVSITKAGLKTPISIS